MGSSVVQMEGVSKRYVLGEDHRGGHDLRDVISGAAARLARRTGPRERQEVWSLRDIDLEIPEGGTLGSSAVTGPARARS
ncbi:hypothetical protein [Baekduia soli]|uniref:hypothetical protein n=1 Tax=Baekduia soli TaxID=496014 RepID=UPI001E56FF4F|nr:hypothetical protein [Baekduia soli]